MGVHNWNRVEDGIFHDCHHAWIEEIKRALNAGLLPEWYYALAVQPGRLDLRSDADYVQPADKPLTLVAYQSRRYSGVTAYVEPVAIGNLLREMPLYVHADGYVSVPLKKTYEQAFAAPASTLGNGTGTIGIVPVPEFSHARNQTLINTALITVRIETMNSPGTFFRRGKTRALCEFAFSTGCVVALPLFNCPVQSLQTVYDLQGKHRMLRLC